ncbi:MAG: glycosyltransferase [Desulfobulbaceae bacterium]|nr:glycosyltransferase [Desulfobulbaceae bacterium]
MKNTVLVVLGMHRSGTSAITKSLPLLGVELGDNLNPANYENPKGFSEDLGCLDINEALLQHLDSSWDKLSLDLKDVLNDPFIMDLKSKASKLIIKNLQLHHGKWGFKDPRTCRLLFFWQDVLASIKCNVCYLIVSRNPLSVAASLNRRNPLLKEKSHFLWLSHVVPSILDTMGENRIFVDFDTFLDSPVKQLIRIATTLGFQIPDPEEERVKKYYDSFLDNGLRHTKYKKDDLSTDKTVPEDIKLAYRLLSQLSLDEASSNDQEIVSLFKGISSRIAANTPLFSQLDNNQDLLTHIAQIKRQLSRSKDENKKLTMKALECDEKISSLSRTLNEKSRILQDVFNSKSWRLTAPLRSIIQYTQTIKTGSPASQSNNILTSPNETSISPPADFTAPDNEPTNISPDFDGIFYSEAYPDTQGLDPYAHYLKYGKSEGRLSQPPVLFDMDELAGLNPKKETVLIVGHEATRSGAPILTLNIAECLRPKYNVIILLLKGGDLTTYFKEKCDIFLQPFPQSHNPNVVSAVLGKLLPSFNIKFAIVNSIVSKPVLPVLAHHFIPSLCLIHEFASFTKSNSPICEVLLWSGLPIYSAQIVYENNTAQCPELNNEQVPILPQGKCRIPGENQIELSKNNEQLINKMLRPEPFPDDTVIILGAGAVQMRKGVELFLACANRVLELKPKKQFRFVWVGHGYNPESDMVYSIFLQDQIIRAGLEKHVLFTGETSDINIIYRYSDIMMLSSRLDPLPNVAIDAMLEGLPVICFDKTTGIADFLKNNGFGESCVMPYLDTEKAAHRIVSLINDTEQRNLLGLEIKKVAATSFNMKSYVNSLEQLALDRVDTQKLDQTDCQYIEEQGGIAIDYYLPPAKSSFSYQQAVRFFVRSWKCGLFIRKPFPGFHPGIYADCHGLKKEEKNPLTHFIEAGKPKGPWLSDIITSGSKEITSNKPLRAALHIHAYFVDLLPDILQRLEENNLPLDLLISTPSPETSQQANTLLNEYTRGQVEIRVVPNRGRDIGPLLTEFNQTIMEKYQIIGHIHTKKSKDVKDAAMGKIWFNFLLKNLLGENFSMGSTILNRLTNDEKLGLVFPDDPHICGWTKNKVIAQELAPQLGIRNLPDRFFDFPLGTMFWAKTKAMEPLFKKSFKWEDYPEEPIPYDGTILHAIERLIPSMVKNAGYQEAHTYVPGITR